MANTRQQTWGLYRTETSRYQREDKIKHPKRTFEPLVLPGLKQVFVGFDKHNSKCCEVCKTCKAPLKSKDMANWKECKGDSVNDVQNFCMEKCAPGYWNEVNTSQCHKCSTCHDGIL